MRNWMQVASAARPKAPIAIGQKHFLVVLVEFADLSFKIASPRQAFSDMLNEAGYSANGATGSARDYYYENSRQTLAEHGLLWRQ